MVEADSREYVANLPRDDRSVAFFIDGPKGKNMPPLFAAIQERFSNVLFIAVHDCERESGSRNRKRVEQYFAPEFPIMYCDGAFQLPYAQLDRCLIGKSELTSWRPFHCNGMKRESYGTETAYILGLYPYQRPRIPRPLLRPYRWVRCGLMKGWV